MSQGAEVAWSKYAPPTTAPPPTTSAPPPTPMRPPPPPPMRPPPPTPKAYEPPDHLKVLQDMHLKDLEEERARTSHERRLRDEAARGEAVRREREARAHEADLRLYRRAGAALGVFFCVALGLVIVAVTLSTRNGERPRPAPLAVRARPASRAVESTPATTATVEPSSPALPPLAVSTTARPSDTNEGISDRFEDPAAEAAPRAGEGASRRGSRSLALDDPRIPDVQVPRADETFGPGSGVRPTIVDPSDPTLVDEFIGASTGRLEHARPCIVANAAQRRLLGHAIGFDLGEPRRERLTALAERTRARCANEVSP